jgi:hypothetical protein
MGASMLKLNKLPAYVLLFILFMPAILGQSMPPQEAMMQQSMPPQEAMMQPYPAEPAYATTPDIGVSGYTIPSGSNLTAGPVYVLPSAGNRLFNLAVTANPNPVSPGSPAEIEVVVSSCDDNLKASNAFVELGAGYGGTFDYPCYSAQECRQARSIVSGFTDSSGSFRVLWYPYPGSTGLIYQSYLISINVTKQGFTGGYGSFIGKVNPPQLSSSSGPSFDESINDLRVTFTTHQPTSPATSDSTSNGEGQEDEEGSRGIASIPNYLLELSVAPSARVLYSDKENLRIAYSDLQVGNDRFSHGDYQGALNVYVAGISRVPKSAKLENYAGDAAMNMGDKKIAASHYKKAVDLNPDLIGAWNNLIICYRDLQMVAKANDAYKQYLEKVGGSK